jgi:hypothetical protein
MRKTDTHHAPPQRPRFNDPHARSETKAKPHDAEVDVKALAKKEIERRLRFYDKLRHA